ncbi:MAG: MFS transporter [Novosphingobium sp.]|nr:MFS transporter [Novosphingobium sp.]MBO9603062.1 MFS transporter [Novosphingobium sp.]
MTETEAAFEQATFSKIAWRLCPLLFAGYFVAFLDRVNVGFAKLQMASDLGLSDAVYGFGAGVFFIGYFLCEMPANLAMVRVGARRWIARIMLTWAVVSAAFLFTGHLRWGPVSHLLGLTDAEFSFYFLRFVLGVAEAGFVPGVLLYLTFWFPASRRAQVMALFFVAIPLASALGSPLSGAILQFMDGAEGLRGWQWLFLVEALPSLLVGFLVLAKLPDGPREARWLSDDERALVERRLAEDDAARQVHRQSHALRHVFTDWRVWAAGLADFSRGVYANALNYWLPTIVQEIGIPKKDYFLVGLVSMIPWGIGAVAMVVVAWSSDRSGERRWHAIGSSLVAAIGCVLLAFAGHSAVVSVLALAMIAAGGLAWLAVFWTLPTAFLSGVAAAAGIGWINAISQLGGFVGPDMLGRLRGTGQGDNTLAFLILAAVALVVTVLTYALSRTPRPLLQSPAP